MLVQLQMVAGVILLVGLLLIVNMIRQRKLELKYAMAWMFAILVMLIVDIFPPILNIISYCFGIATPVNTLFLLGFIFALVLIFVLTVAVSRQAERLRRLTQALAISQEKINELEKQMCYNGKNKENQEK